MTAKKAKAKAEAEASYPRLSAREAQEQGRCACLGCPTCTGDGEHACGMAGLNGDAYCSWCRQERRKARAG